GRWCLGVCEVAGASRLVAGGGSPLGTLSPARDREVPCAADSRSSSPRARVRRDARDPRRPRLEHDVPAYRCGLGSPLGARRVLDAPERPVRFEPFADGAPERGVQLRLARPRPGAPPGIVIAVGTRVDVDALD